MKYGSITTGIIADGLVFNMDAANRASTKPISTVTTSFNTVNLTESGSFSDNGIFDSSTITPSFAFDGTNDINCGNNSVFNNTFTGNSFSFSAWIKSSSNVAYDGILNFGSRVQSFLNSNKIKIWLQGSSGFIVTAFTSNTTISSDTWYYIVFIKNGNGNTLYINGVSDNTVTSTGSVATTTSGLRIGSYLGTQYFWDGNIGPIHLYNRALSANEVLHNYNALKSRFE